MGGTASTPAARCPSPISTFMLIGTLALGAGGTGSEDGTLPRFTEVGMRAGIDFEHAIGDDELSSILESSGVGCAFFDYDGDGDLDLYAVNGCYIEGTSGAAGRPLAGRLGNRLYRNNGDGTFRDVTEEGGVGDRGYGMGCVAGDIDNDGDSDLYVTNYGRNVLYRNNGDGTFTEGAEAAGVAHDSWSIGAVFLDYDRDGWVDLYVGSYLGFDPAYRAPTAPGTFPGPLAYPGVPDVLYRNHHDGTFRDVTREAGVFRPDGRAMGVGACDYDDDGDVDIYVSNDAMANFLWRNNGDGTFEDVGLLAGTAYGAHGEVTSSMCPDFGDIDHDGDLDLFVPDMSCCSLYRNLGEGYFEDQTAQLGIASVMAEHTSWSCGLFDYDNDTNLDLVVTTGDSFRLSSPEKGVLFRNNGDGSFRDVSAISGDYFHTPYVGRGCAFGDVDNDGDVDLCVMNLNGRAVLLRNDGGNRNHWLSVRVVGTGSNRDAIGARVRIVAGNITQIQDVRAGTGYLSHRDFRVHFGLGSAKEAERLEVRWPSGTVKILGTVKANQFITVKEPRR